MNRVDAAHLWAGQTHVECATTIVDGKVAAMTFVPEPHQMQSPGSLVIVTVCVPYLGRLATDIQSAVLRARRVREQIEEIRKEHPNKSMSQACAIWVESAKVAA